MLGFLTTCSLAAIIYHQKRTCRHKPAVQVFPHQITLRISLPDLIKIQGKNRLISLPSEKNIPSYMALRLVAIDDDLAGEIPAGPGRTDNIAIRSRCKNKALD